MQILRNKTTNEEYPITGSISVPREIDENTFEVWMHFSVDLGEGRVDTIEIHPESTEYEVLDIPDSEPILEDVIDIPEATELEIVEPTQEELDRNFWLSEFRRLQRNVRAKQELEAAGLTFTDEEEEQHGELIEWVSKNRKPEYIDYI